MNKAISDIKTVKKQLNDFKYVSRLKSLTHMERDVLSALYHKKVCKIFPMPFHSVKNTIGAQKAFNDIILQVEQYIINYNIISPIIDNQHSYNGLTLKGFCRLTDKRLIQCHKKTLQQKEDKKKLISKNRALAKKARQVASQCQNKAEALYFVKALYDKFPFAY